MKPPLVSDFFILRKVTPSVYRVVYAAFNCIRKNPAYLKPMNVYSNI